MSGREEDSGILRAGVAAPKLELKELAGERQSLHGMLERGPVLLAFYKVSCPVCQLTFPFLERLSKNDIVQVIGISQDDTKSTQAFNDRFGVTFPTLLDEAKDGYPVSNGFAISSVPTMFVVEPDGTISKSIEGFSKRELESVGDRVNVRPFLANEYVPEFKAG
jgi:peroxiredoxin